jgi:hypothetical protein
LAKLVLIHQKQVAQEPNAKIDVQVGGLVALVMMLHQESSHVVP